MSLIVWRLSLYGLTILFIPLRDVWIVRPPLSSELWLNLFTIVFVLGFIMELGRNFLAGYSRHLATREKLEDEHKRTKAALDAKTRFLATVSHELRTPLTSIKGAFDMMNSGAFGELPQKVANLFKIASRNTDKLKDLVDDLLFLQSSDIGKIKFDFKRVDLGEIIEEATERFEPYAEKFNVSLQTQYSVGEYWINADKKRMDQVLMNLISNAAKFSENSGKVFISVEAEEGLIRLSVRDEGIGIPAGSEEQVFAEFSQLDSRDERKFEGSGLGLSISKRIVEAHHGQIYYTSELGVGTTFTVELKMAAPLAE
ncbi:MAG: sensor histidine kinase [Sulfitobacter sp.]